MIADAAAGTIGPATSTGAITVLYDTDCALCRRCRQWMETQRTWVPVTFVAATSDEATARRRDVPWLGAELVVVGESGEVWVGAAAFLVCLWATVDHRPLSYRLATPSLAPLAERFFHTVSSNRRLIGRVVGTPDCPDGRCRHRDETWPLIPPPAPVPDERAVDEQWARFAGRRSW